MKPTALSFVLIAVIAFTAGGKMLADTPTPASAQHTPASAEDNKEAATPLMAAAAAGKIDMLQQLLDKGVDIDERSKTGGTPLMYDDYSGQIVFVLFLF